ncbi:hypothetical protein [Curtobacterium sp. BRB10]|uniref:hypothetical protein n=1 Tax=Curtobacterium sp. BRB10 TaxID=2962579 RepID=UPI00288111A1|nr:hypothetical protein [Curtobacterium sp. BRB10]MDT0234778.1 hypothetical protein [Curtobacterium sp. BRB10]
MTDGSSYVGQVLTTDGDELFIVIFDFPISDSVDLTDVSDALVAEPLVASWTHDERFRPDAWSVIGQAPADTQRLLPAFTWGLPATGGVRVTNFSGSRTRMASAEEAARIPQKTLRSPALIERFLRANAGVDPWLDVLEKVRYHPTPSSAELFPE